MFIKRVERGASVRTNIENGETGGRGEGDGGEEIINVYVKSTKNESKNEQKVGVYCKTFHENLSTSTHNPSHNQIEREETRETE